MRKRLYNFGQFGRFGSGGGSAPSTTTAIQGNVSVVFDSAVTTGNYIDGPAYIVVPTGTITATSKTPAQTTVSTKIVNGTQKNPVVEAKQGYDERDANFWDASRNVTFPMSVTAGDILVMPIYNSYVLSTDGIVSEWASFHIVASEPAANSMSPAAIGWTGRTSNTPYVIDTATWLAALGSDYDTSAHTDAPTYAEIMSRLDFYNPIMGQHQSYNWYQVFSPADSGGSNSSLQNFGLNYSATFSAAGAALRSTEYTDSEKTAILKRLVSIGVQIYDTMKGEGTAFGKDGGHWGFYIVPVALALELTGRSASLATLVADLSGNYEQMFRFDAARVTAMSPHSLAANPYVSRIRTLSAVATNNIEMDDFALEPYWYHVTGLNMVRNGGSAGTAVVNSMASEHTAGGGFEVVIDAQPSPAFVDTESAVFEAPYTHAVGDVDWALNGWGVSYSPSATATYRDQSKGSLELLTLYMLDVFPDDADIWRDYIIQANTVNSPTATLDWPSHHGTFYPFTGGALNWATEWWSDYSTDILPANDPAVTIQGVGGTTSYSSSHTYSSSSKVGSVALPATFPAGKWVVMVSIDEPKTITSVTIDGVAATLKASHLGSVDNSYCYEADITGGVSDDIVVATSGSVSTLCVAAWLVENASYVGNVGVDVAFGNPTVATLDMNTTATDALMCLATYADTAGAPTWAGLVETSGNDDMGARRMVSADLTGATGGTPEAFELSVASNNAGINALNVLYG